MCVQNDFERTKYFSEFEHKKTSNREGHDSFWDIIYEGVNIFFPLIDIYFGSLSESNYPVESNSCQTWGMLLNKCRKGSTRHFYLYLSIILTNAAVKLLLFFTKTLTTIEKKGDELTIMIWKRRQRGEFHFHLLLFAIKWNNKHEGNWNNIIRSLHHPSSVLTVFIVFRFHPLTSIFCKQWCVLNCFTYCIFQKKVLSRATYWKWHSTIIKWYS